MRMLTILLALLSAALAQSPTFEVATIKPAAPDARGRFSVPAPKAPPVPGRANAESQQVT